MDAVTAESVEIPWDVLCVIRDRIINEVPGINRVLWDFSDKPVPNLMITPEMFVDRYKDEKYAELLPIRDKLIAEIRRFEVGDISEEEKRIDPAPDVIYQAHLEYLGKLVNVI